MQSWHERFRRREEVAALLDTYLRLCGLSFLGYRAPRGLLHDIKFSEVPALFRPDVYRNSHEFLFGAPMIRLEITWEDSDWVETTADLSQMSPFNRGTICSPVRLQVMGSIPEDDFSFAKAQFILLLDLTSAFWGELNVTTMTDRITFVGSHAHQYYMPKLGTMNYLGADYVDFLGRENLSAAGFSWIEPHGEGILTAILVKSRAEFSDTQNSVCATLGGAAVFEDWCSCSKPVFRTLQHHVLKHASTLPPMEFRVTEKGLKKRVLRPKTEQEAD